MKLLMLVLVLLGVGCGAAPQTKHKAARVNGAFIQLPADQQLLYEPVYRAQHHPQTFAYALAPAPAPSRAAIAVPKVTTPLPPQLAYAAIPQGHPVAYKKVPAAAPRIPVQYVTAAPQPQYVPVRAVQVPQGGVRKPIALHRFPGGQVLKPDEQPEEDIDPNPQYNFSFDVKDDEYTNYQNRQENRDGDVIKGSYSVVDSDGYVRTVTYTADAVNGFQAKVVREPTDIQVKIPVPPPTEVPTKSASPAILKAVRPVSSASLGAHQQHAPTPVRVAAYQPQYAAQHQIPQQIYAYPQHQPIPGFAYIPNSPKRLVFRPQQAFQLPAPVKLGPQAAFEQ